MITRIFAITSVHPDPNQRVSMTREWEGPPLSGHEELYSYLRLEELGDREFRVERLYEKEAYIFVSHADAEVLLADPRWMLERDYHDQMRAAA